MDHEQTLLTITAMRRQEETVYFACDYFHIVEDEEDDSNSASPTLSGSRNNSCSSAPCDASCREIMYHWMVKVVDFFPSMHRETVAYAMSYLDRFLQTKPGKQSRLVRSSFQLAAIACLYTAVKLHESAAVSPKFLEQLSRDEYTEDDLCQMELTILQALKWRLTTPTAVGFLRQYMDIIPEVLLQAKSGDGSLHNEVFAMAKYQTEVALGDYKYVSVNASIIAYCALNNALEAYSAVSNKNRRSILWFVSEAAEVDRDSAYTLEIQRSLHDDNACSACSGSADTSTKRVGSGSYVFPMGHEVTSPSDDDKSECASPNRNHSPRTVCE